MSDKKIPDIFMEQFKPENLTTVKEVVPVDDIPFPDPPPEPQVRSAEPEPEEPDYEEIDAEEFNYEDDDDPVGDFIEDIGAGGEGMDQKGREAFAEMIVDVVGLAKEGINFFFSHRFTKAIEQNFKRTDQELLYTIMALDQEDLLTLDELRKTADSTRHDLKELLRVKVTYANIKKQWQTTEYKEKVQDGIRRNAIRVAEKYFGDSEPNPILMLGLFIVVALGVDVGRLAYNTWQAKRKEDGDE